MSRASERFAAAVASGQRRLGGPGQGHHRGEALGEGVVDLTGEPLALGQHPSLPFRRRELGLGLAQLVDDPGPAVGLADDPVDEEPEHQ
jgi:hypothetical protein